MTNWLPMTAGKAKRYDSLIPAAWNMGDGLESLVHLAIIRPSCSLVERGDIKCLCHWFKTDKGHRVDYSNFLGSCQGAKDVVVYVQGLYLWIGSLNLDNPKTWHTAGL
jgi:hypothetical protein